MECSDHFVFLSWWGTGFKIHSFGKPGNLIVLFQRYMLKALNLLVNKVHNHPAMDRM